MNWAALSLVTDADLGGYEPEATAASAPWRQVTWTSQRSLAKRDLKVWLEIAFPDVPTVADRVLDVWAPDWLYTLTGGSYTDRTSNASNDTESDVDLATAFTTPASDRIYVACGHTFDGLDVAIGSTLNATTSALTVKYWNGTAWTALTATDGTAVTSGKTFSGSGRITWTAPTSWARRRFAGTADEYFWIELSVSATLTSGTVATQILPIHAPDGLKAVACFQTLAYIFKGLAAQAAVPQSWLDRAKDYEERARTLFEQLKLNGLIPIDRNHDQVIEPAIERGSVAVQPVRLYRG